MTGLATPDQEPTAEADTFVSVGTPTAMAEADLRACARADGEAGPDQAAVYAVAYIPGVVQNSALHREWRAVNVLYMTADGERAVERWYKRTTPDDLHDVDRACIAPEDDLEPVEEGARRFASTLNQHPEL